MLASHINYTADFIIDRQCHLNFLCFVGNSSLDEDDATLISEGQNLHNELQISSIRSSISNELQVDLYNFKCSQHSGYIDKQFVASGIH